MTIVVELAEDGGIVYRRYLKNGKLSQTAYDNRVAAFET